MKIENIRYYIRYYVRLKSGPFNIGLRGQLGDHSTLQRLIETILVEGEPNVTWLGRFTYFVFGQDSSDFEHVQVVRFKRFRYICSLYKGIFWELGKQIFSLLEFNLYTICLLYKVNTSFL